MCAEYPTHTGGPLHPYIPLLAVHPHHEGKGHGRRILEHLIAEASKTVKNAGVSPTLFLDVYAANVRAIGLYEKFGFVTVSDLGDYTDPDEGDEPYLVLAKLLPPTP